MNAFDAKLDSYSAESRKEDVGRKKVMFFEEREKGKSMQRVSFGEESTELDGRCFRMVGARPRRQPNSGTDNGMLNANQRLRPRSGLYIDPFAGARDHTPLFQAVETDA